MKTLLELTAALDRAEERADGRIGGPSERDHRLASELERRIGDRPADCLGVALWRARRLARAVANNWCDEFAQPLAAALERDLAAYG